jgi:hypothetical protein
MDPLESGEYELLKEQPMLILAATQTTTPATAANVSSSPGSTYPTANPDPEQVEEEDWLAQRIRVRA